MVDQAKFSVIALFCISLLAHYFYACSIYRSDEDEEQDVYKWKEGKVFVHCCGELCLKGNYVMIVRFFIVWQAKKSTEGICAIVARTGDVKQCPYAANCRFNHDLEGYLAQVHGLLITFSQTSLSLTKFKAINYECYIYLLMILLRERPFRLLVYVLTLDLLVVLQKPSDLPGRCPSLDTGEPCSYGIACRFAGTHKNRDTHEGFQERRSNTASNELNSLSKELQKVLWKNMGLYPKADAQLQAMGLMV